MRNSDRKLGMDWPITRRDVIHGIGAAGVSFALPGSLQGCAKTTPENPIYYPPALTGMRGSHDGSFEVAHALAREGRTDWGPAESPDSIIYDLVVVGGGISGLSTAHFYRKKKPDARILILDNHDDFGGHAKRNEFDVDGTTLLIHGGSETMAAPSSYSDIVKGLLSDLRVDITRFDTAYDQQFYRRHGLRTGVHFTEEKWGINRFVPLSLGYWENFITSAESDLSPEETVAQLPMTDAAKRQLLRLVTTTEDQIPNMPVEDKVKYLVSISYSDFLRRHLDIDEPQIFAMFQDASEFGAGPDATPAIFAMAYSG
jgi:spermidine dehydrogenase